MIVEQTKSDNKDFELVSAGTHHAVCVDNVDLGIETSEYDGEKKDQPKIRLMFEVEEMTEGFEEGFNLPKVIGRKCTASLHERSNLTGILQTWLGRELTSEESTRFDLDDLIGMTARLEVLHVPGRNDEKNPSLDPAAKKKMFAIIDRVYPSDKKIKASGNYIRAQDRV